MKRVTIKKLSLTNFKGLRNYSIAFNGDTEVSGANGTGKTTLLDAFTWVLFGKDSQGRDKFRIKTIGESGEIPRIEHEVSLTLDVDGQECTLRRCYKEKWVKRRGQVEERFEGHEEERYYNDVPCSVAEYKAKVGEICTEDLFKLLSMPSYFPSLKPMAQREILISLAGGITDEEVAIGDAEMTALLGRLTGKTLEEYRKEVGAKKNRVKAEAETLPGRIDELKRMMPEEQDYEALQKEKAEKQAKVAEIDKQLADAGESMRAAVDAKINKQRELGRVRSAKLEIEAEAEDKAEAKHNEEVRKHKDNELAIKTYNAELTKAMNESNEINMQIRRNRDLIKECESERAKLLEEWQAIQKSKLTIAQGELVCPTCKRPLEATDRQAKIKELTDNFNKDRADRLERNKAKGMKNNARKQQLEAENEELAKKAESLETSMSMYREEIDMRQTSEAHKAVAFDPEPVDYSTLGKEYDELCEKEQRLLNELATEAAPYEQNTELTEAKATLNAAIDELNEMLANRAIAERTKKRQQELEEQLQNQLEEIAKHETEELLISQFSQLRVKKMEDKINKMFDLVKFKMFDTQVNGAIVETCEATVGGIPYSTLNNAARINAGLDIIEGISRKQGMRVPIFIDNAESVNHFYNHKEAQLILLKVTRDPQLTAREII